MEYTHLTEEERYHIDDLKREGFTQKGIAESLKRSASTVNRAGDTRVDIKNSKWMSKVYQVKQVLLAIEKLEDSRNA